MLISGVLDALLVILLLGYISIGWLLGFLRSVFGIAGLVLGAIGSFLLSPLIGSWVSSPAWRPIVVVCFVAFLLVAGQLVGLVIGRAIAHSFEGSKISIVDRIAGILLNFVVAALVASSAAFSIGSLGVPWISQAISRSVVLNSINKLTPDPVKQAMAQLRAAVVQQGIPRIISAAEGGAEHGSKPPKAPSPVTPTDPSAIERAAQSVVRVSGSAFQCGQNQSGSGAVIAENRVLTNAHVVAGVTEPVVEIPGVGAYPGRVVYFDPQHDLAIVATSGMQAKPLELGDGLQVGETGIFDGYPFGGPFQTAPARVDRVLNARVNNIYGRDPQLLEVYELAANVQEGNSGGPLLDASGHIVGLIFAKSANTAGIGYAITNTELQPVVDQASALTSKVNPGHCVRP